MTPISVATGQTWTPTGSRVPRSTPRAPVGTGAAKTTERSMTTTKHDPTGEFGPGEQMRAWRVHLVSAAPFPPPPVLAAGNSPGSRRGFFLWDKRDNAVLGGEPLVHSPSTGTIAGPPQLLRRP